MEFIWKTGQEILDKKIHDKMAELTSAVILDSGSGFIKAGLAQNDFPTVCAPNILIQAEEQQGSDTVHRLFGKEALKRLGELSAAG